MSHTNYRRKPRGRHKNEKFAWKNASAWRQIIVQQERAASRIVVYTNIVRVPVPKRIPRPWWLLIGIMTMPHYSPPKQKLPAEPQKKPLFGDAPPATCHVVMRKDPGLGWSPIAVFSSGEPALKHAEDFMEKIQAKRPDLELRIEDRIPLISTLTSATFHLTVVN